VLIAALSFEFAEMPIHPSPLGDIKVLLIHQVLRQHQSQVLVLRRADRRHPYTAPYCTYHVGSKWQCHHRWVKINNVYLFQNKDIFLTSRWFQCEPE
jgi:hypothetical protein